MVQSLKFHEFTEIIRMCQILLAECRTQYRVMHEIMIWTHC